jgi:hypothetical protein
MIGWALRILVAGTLIWAAVGKWRSPATPLIDGGWVPRRLSIAASSVLAAIEACVAVVVLVPATHSLGGICTAILGLAFTAVLATRWMRGADRQSCACFGARAERPAWLVTTRAALVAVAGGLIATDVNPTISHNTQVGLALVGLTIAVIVLVILVLALYRQVGVLERRLGPRTALEIPEEGPPFGQRAPELAGLTGRGSELIAFGSEGCRLCRELTPGFRALTRDGLAIRGVDEDTEPDAFNRFRVPGTPYVVHMVDGVVVAKGLVNTLEQVEELVGVGLERAQHAP